MTPKEIKAQARKERMKKEAQEKTAAAKAAHAKRAERINKEIKERQELHQYIEVHGPKRFFLDNGGVGNIVRSPAYKKYGFKGALKYAAMAAAAAAIQEPEANTKEVSVSNGESTTTTLTTEVPLERLGIETGDTVAIDGSANGHNGEHKVVSVDSVIASE